MDRDAAKKRIEAAVIERMANTEIKSISVKEICIMAGVSRSTFYRIFDSVPNVVYSLEMQLLERVRDINRYFISASFPSGQTLTIVRSLTQLMYEQRDFINAVSGPYGDPQFVDLMNSLATEYYAGKILIEAESMENIECKLQFAISGLHGLIGFWLREKPEVSPETMADMINQFMFDSFSIKKKPVKCFSGMIRQEITRQQNDKKQNSSKD